MQTMADRLKWAREEKAGIPSARQAALKLRLPPSTYAAHENAQNEFDPGAARRYAKAFGVLPGWLLTGEGEPAAPAGEASTVPVVGYVAAGSEARFFSDQGEIDRVAAPEGSTENTVAVVIRGNSLGPAFDGAWVFYDDVRRPITPDLIGRLCVVGIEDGRILIKLVQRSKARGLYHLISQTEPPILDVTIEWAARVKNVVLR